jgi:hypothetical protein
MVYTSMEPAPPTRDLILFLLDSSQTWFGMEGSADKTHETNVEVKLYYVRVSDSLVP